MAVDGLKELSLSGFMERGNRDIACEHIPILCLCL